MEDISRMNTLQTRLLIIGVVLLALVAALYFRVDTFVSQVYLDTQRKGAAIPADPTCQRGQYSKKTGGPCSGGSDDKYDYDKDPPQTALGANGERHNVGTYDSDPNPEDEVDYTKLDVLKHPSDLKGPTTYDADTKNRYKTEKKYEKYLRSRGYADADREDAVDAAYKRAAKARDYEDVPKFEDDYMDNRLSRDYASRKRQFERPSDEKYNTTSTRGYRYSNNYKSYNYDDDEDEDYEEGFSPLK